MKTRQQQLASVRRMARHCEALWRRQGQHDDEPALAELRRLQLVRFTAGKNGRGWWRSTVNEGLVWPGLEQGCPALATWGDDTRRALWPRLKLLHEAEDQLVRLLGAPARPRRVLTPPEPLILRSPAAPRRGTPGVPHFPHAGRAGDAAARSSQPDDAT